MKYAFVGEKIDPGLQGLLPVDRIEYEVEADANMVARRRLLPAFARGRDRKSWENGRE